MIFPNFPGSDGNPKNPKVPKVPKLSRRVPTRLNDVIGRVKINETEKKGLAVEYVLHLARLKPNHTTRDFGNSSEASVNLGMQNDVYGLFAQFRESFSPVLSTGESFFAKALVVGASLYEDGYRLSDKHKFRDATLIPPPTKEEEPKSGG